MSKRRKAREMALQMLYQSDVGEASWQQVEDRYNLAEYAFMDADPISAATDVLTGRSHVSADDDTVVEVVPGESLEGASGPALKGRRLEEAQAYAARLTRGVLEHCEELDALIRQQAENWRIERMPPVDRNVLRMAVYELLYEKDVPGLVVVDEAIELGKLFGSEKSGQFINGVLDGLLHLERVGGAPD